MASRSCWHCLTKSSPHTSAKSISAPRLRSPCNGLSASFSTSSVFRKASTPAPRRGEKTTFRVKKKIRLNESKARPPAPGERRAMRKRIVLSNTNAFEVAGMADLDTNTMVDRECRGSVLGIPGPVVDQLRAIEAFKPTQSWAFFRRPGVLFREETLELGLIFDKISEGASNRVVRKLIVGERGSGKSLYLLQAISMAFLKNWVVINIPEGTFRSPRLYVKVIIKINSSNGLNECSHRVWANT